MGFRYGSIEHYRVLAHIEKRLIEYRAEGIPPEDRAAFDTILDLVATERKAASVRAAEEKAESIRRQRPVTKEIASAES